MQNQIKMLAIASAAAAMLSACGGGGGGGGGDEEPPPSFVSCTGDVCTLTGTINENYTLTADKKWRLADGWVYVGAGNVQIADAAQAAAIKAAGVTLTIEPGTDIRGTSNSVLNVTRGSKIVANGTASKPITFSSLDEDFNGLGEWGGVIIQGFAAEYGKGDTGACFGSGTICNLDGEGGTGAGKYGGNDDADNSGSLKYVRIAEAGLVAGPNNEVNGLTLQGVGYGTTIDFVQVHGSLDDGIEWFGGTVNAKHLVLTGNDDDDIDFDEGWRGNIQYALVRKDPTKATPSGTNDPRGIEANSGNLEFVSATNGALANLTIIGGPAANAGGKQPGVLARGAVTVALTNSAVKGFDLGCVRIQDASSTAGGAVDKPSKVTLKNVLGDCNAGFYVGSRIADTADNASPTTFTLDGAYALQVGNATLSGAVTIPAVNNGSGFTFEATDYVGAVKPGTAASAAWWAGWTIPGSL